MQQDKLKIAEMINGYIENRQTLLNKLEGMTNQEARKYLQYLAICEGKMQEQRLKVFMEEMPETDKEALSFHP